MSIINHLHFIYFLIFVVAAVANCKVRVLVKIFLQIVRFK